MNDQLFGPVEFGGGARWIPLASPADPAHLQVAHAVLDVAIVLRGTTPNLNLGDADDFIWAGEWELALDELAAVIESEPRNGPAGTMLSRARAIMASLNTGTEQ